MKATNKIDAIRIIRNLGVIVQPAKSENGVDINKVVVDISLFAAKELVESIMELGQTSMPKQLKEAEDTILYLRNNEKHLHDKFYKLEEKYYALLTKLRNLSVA